jgi:hypothetical protein
MTELNRIDPDGERHWGFEKVADGAIVKQGESCGFQRHGKSPMFMLLMSQLCSVAQDALVYMKCDEKSEAIVASAGMLPYNRGFRNVLQGAIEWSIKCEEVDYANANGELMKFYE